MSNCPGCDNSSTTYSRCNPPVSSNCVFYKGDTLTCPSDPNFQICRDSSITDVVANLFGEICSIDTSLDVTSFVFPAPCASGITQGWKYYDDKTIKGLFSYLGGLTCGQQSQIDGIIQSIQNINPIYTDVNLCCCATNCGTGPQQYDLKSIINTLVSCVCAARTAADNATTLASTAQSQINSLQSQVDFLATQVSSLLAANLTLQQNIATITAKTYCLPNC